MFIKDRMTSNPYCINQDTSISNALDIMESNSFHRLPVVENGKLIGLITESTIENNTPGQATSLSIYELNYLLSKTSVKEIMIKDVITISKDALIEEAAVLMRKQNIGCLVVVDEDNLVIGIITRNDILDAFIDLLGYNRKGNRFVIYDVEDKPGAFHKITELFYNLGANIYNLGVYHQNNQVDVVAIVKGDDPKLLKLKLEELGYVVSVSEYK